MKTTINKLAVLGCISFSTLLISSCDYPEFNIPANISSPTSTTPGDTTQENTTSAEDADPKKTFAIINGLPVSRNLFSLYESQRKGKRPVSNRINEQKELEDEFINMELLAQNAIKRGLDKYDDVNGNIMLQKKSILVTAIINDLREQEPITGEQLQAEYDLKYKQTIPQEYSTRHILVEKKSKALEIIKQLDKGEDFSKLATQNSIGPAANEGGALEWFKQGDVIPEFLAAVKQLKKGQYSSTSTQSRYGWHILLLEDTRQGKVPGIDQVRDQLKKEIHTRRLEQYIQKLRKEADIQVLSSSILQ